MKKTTVGRDFLDRSRSLWRKAHLSLALSVLKKRRETREMIPGRAAATGTSLLREIAQRY